MPAFYRSTLSKLLNISESEIVGILSSRYAATGFTNQRTDQTTSWIADLAHLKKLFSTVIRDLPAALQWTVLLEFEIPRKGNRIDVVLLAGEAIFLFELKSGSVTAADRLQVEEYALLLHYFHQPSSRRKIYPFLLSPQAEVNPNRNDSQTLFPEMATFWIAPVEQGNWSYAAQRILEILPHIGQQQLDGAQWERGAYFPVPSIIEAALSLQSGLSIREIAHSQAAQHDIVEVTSFIQSKVDEARVQGQHIICFVTGVPGSGKTLVGLNLAYSRQSDASAIHFMSGNGPLVKVLQTAFARHQRERGVRAVEARIYARTLIENIHRFASTYTDQPTPQAPSNHVVIFDEAQRAWDRAQNERKFKRFYSEPEMLLRIMERHQDWAAIIALVGGGQEINSGEAGLAEWGRSLEQTSKPWKIFASPEALFGGDSVAGNRLFSDDKSHANVVQDQQLHLKVSVRNLRAERFAKWVNHVVNGEPEEAARLKISDDFPLFLVRDLDRARLILKGATLGVSRTGLVGSSAASRLRAEGLEPSSDFHANYPWEHWYLGARTDIRSSNQLEVFATEFEIQGLELDWIGVCWGGDFIWSLESSSWLARNFSHKANSAWSVIRNETRTLYRKNSYRVLLTRARQGLVIYVPPGNPTDPTRNPKEFDDTAAFLLACGAKSVS